MCAYICIHMYMCIYMCIYVCVYICMYIYVCVGVYVCIYMCMCIYVCMCMYIYVCMCVCVCIYICVYVCIYAEYDVSLVIVTTMFCIFSIWSFCLHIYHYNHLAFALEDYRQSVPDMIPKWLSLFQVHPHPSGVSGCCLLSSLVVQIPDL